MRFSVEWLREHVAVPGAPDDLGRRLTAAGLALDALETVDGDAILDLDIPSNRPDCMNVRGVAREAAAAYRLPLAPLEPLLEAPASGPPAAESVTVSVEVPEECRRFAARVVRGVRIAPSPEWLAARLRKAGLRPVNNLVDITNYVMLELGHPLHAFDLHTLRDGRIRVRLAAPGERLRTLDGTERRLQDWMIVVADSERAVSLAGVMGGQETEIGPGTVDVLLEAAWWNPVTIYRTARELGLASDASYRFERGADPEACGPALDRAARLAAEVAGGSVAPGTVDDYPGRQPPRSVRLRPARIGALLGVDVDAEEVRRGLGALGFGVRGPAQGPWTVSVPSSRPDVAREEDLVEEAGRALGFDRIPERLPLVESEEHGLPPDRRRLRQVCRTVEGTGFLEALHYSMVPRADDAVMSPWPGDAVALANPMSEKGEILRTALAPALFRSAALNFRHGADRVRLFEVGRVFRSRPEGGLPEERLHLALLAAGRAAPRHWGGGPERDADLFDVKGVLEALTGRGLLPSLEEQEGGPEFLRRGAALVLRHDGGTVGWIGAPSAEAARALELEAPAAAAEIDLGALLDAPRRALRYRPLPRFPAVVRDLSLVLPLERRYQEVERAIRDAGGGMVTAVAAFDRYTGKGLPPGTTGLSVSIRFQHADRTLVSEEVDTAQARIVDALRRDLGAELRG